MKKLLLLLVGFVVTLSASAQLYVTGDNVVNGSKWDPANALEVSEQNGGYTFQATGTFKISKTKGGWDTFNNDGFKLGSEWSVDGKSATASLTGSADDIASPASGEVVTYTVSSDYSTISATWGEVTPPVEIKHNFYLVGENFGGWNKDDSYRFSTEDYQTYTFELNNEEATGSGEFKIFNGDWYKNGGIDFCGKEGETLTANQLYELDSNVDNGPNLSTTLPKHAKFTFTYNPEGTSTLLITGADDPIIPPVAAGKIYMHFKYDLMMFGADNATPKCRFVNTSNWSKSAPVDMALERDDNRYALWVADLSEENAANYNAVEFYFTDKDGNERVYRSYSWNGDQKDLAYFNQAEWTKYIYASAATTEGKPYAVQSYLTYDKFTELDNLDIANGGRRHLYLIGWGTNGNQIKCFDDNGQEVYMPDEQPDALKITSEEGCFYLPVEPHGGSFKISWISVNDAVSALSSNDTQDSQRAWATFDLGLIGVDLDYAYPSGRTLRDDVNGLPDGFDKSKSVWFERDANNPNDNGKLHFVRNVSARYMNYNQADWVLPDNVDNLPTVGQKRWLVVDTHFDEGDYNCKTATITSFDPDPKVSAAVTEAAAQEGEIDQDLAEQMHVDHLYRAEENGHVIMTRVNKAVGTAEIEATDISTVKNADFTRKYTIYVNDKVVGTFQADDDNLQQLKEIKIDNFPLAVADDGETLAVNKIAVRSRYTDGLTGLSFHSRIGESEATTSFDFPAPSANALKGTYVIEKIDEDGTQHYGVNVENIKCEVSTDKNVYSDFTFDFGSKVYFVDHAHKAEDGSLLYPSFVPAWEGWTHGGDWSTKLIDDTNAGKGACVYIPDVVAVASVDMLQNMDVNCTMSAVYPFMYDTEAHFETNASLAPRREPRATSGLKLYNSYASVNIPFTIPADTAVSAIDGVEADTAAGEAVYYTVSGVRVDGVPASGIYVRVCGDKVDKVVIR